jgi:hypothetical protein
MTVLLDLPESTSFCGEIGKMLMAAFQRDNARFLEPLQQLTILRRAMTVSKENGTVDIASQEGFKND